MNLWRVLSARQRATVQSIFIVAGLLTVFIGINTGFLALEVNQDLPTALGLTVYVSPTGNDNNPGTLEQPFKTITKARNVVRGTPGSTVYLRGGSYELTSPVDFGSNDSGSSGQANVYRAYQDEQPVITGGEKITNITSAGNNIYQANLATQTVPISNVKDTYLNGTRLRTAQIPNWIDPKTKFYQQADPWAGNFFYVDASQGQNVTDTLNYKSSDFNPAGWTNRTNIEVVIYSQDLGKSVTSVRKIQSIDEAQHIITLVAQNGAPAIAAHEPYYIRNVKEELNTNGEYYVDGSTLLLYSTQIIGANDDVRIPIIDHIFTASSNTHHLEFRDLTLQETAGSAIELTGTQTITVNNNIIRRTSREGVYAGSEATRTLVVKNNHLSDIGATGVLVSTGNNNFDTQVFKDLVNQGILIQNNDIQDFGRQDDTAIGIISYGTVGTLIANNEVANGPRMGIRIDGNDNVIRQNKVHDIGQGAGSFDLAAIKPSSGRNWLLRGNVVENNEIYHTGGYRGLEGDIKFSWFSYSIYSDDLGSDTTITGNLIRDPARGIYLHGGRDNEVSGNILAIGPHSETDQYPLTTDADTFWYNTPERAEEMWARLRDMEANGYNKTLYYQRYPELASITDVIPPSSDCQLTGQTICTLYNNHFERNIVYAPNATGTFLYFKAGEALEYMQLTSDHNVVFENNRPMVSRVQYGACIGTYTWDEWRNYHQGACDVHNDVNSVQADPLFVDPEHGDYHLQSNSPARALGFVEIDQAKIGTHSIYPTKPVVEDDGDQTTVLNQISAHWSATTYFGSIENNEYRLTTESPTGPLVYDWTSVGQATSVTVPLNLTGGQRYFFAVRATNDDERVSEVGNSDGITAVEQERHNNNNGNVGEGGNTGGGTSGNTGSNNQTNRNRSSGSGSQSNSLTLPPVLEKPSTLSSLLPGSTTNAPSVALPDASATKATFWTKLQHLVSWVLLRLIVAPLGVLF